MKIRIRIPCVGEIVLVGTAENFNGSNEHPAIVNKVHSDDVINATVVPDMGEPFVVTSVLRSEREDYAPVSRWRWPETQKWKAIEVPTDG